MVSDSTYPKKTITTVLVIYFSIGFTYNLIRLLNDLIIDVHFTIYYTFSYLIDIATLLFFLSMSLYFVYLLDSNHDS